MGFNGKHYYKRTFFDTLDDIALENLVRHLSSHPRKLNWPRFLKIQDVALLCRLGGELSSFIQNRFDSVCIFNLSDRRNMTKLNQLKESENTLVVNGNKNNIEMMHEILCHLISKIKTLNVGFPYTSGAEFLDQFLPNSGPLDGLSLISDGEKWIKMFGSKIQTLHINGDSFGVLSGAPLLNSIMKNCMHLRELHIPSIRLRDMDNARLIMKGIGTTVEKLSVCDYSPGNELLPIIENSCLKLKWLEATSLKNSAWPKALQKCIMSYGPQLEYALLDILPANEIKIITETCPNARFKIHFVWETPIDVVRHLGNQLLDARLHSHGQDVVDFEYYSSAWELCTNIETLNLWRFNHEYIGSIFSLPKCMLKNLVIYTDKIDHELGDVLELIANRTGALENISLALCINQMPNLSVFHRLVRNNCSLVSMKLCLYGVHFSYENVKYLLETFLSAPTLTKLTLEDERKLTRFPNLKKSPSLNKGRRLSVTVNGIQYH